MSERNFHEGLNRARKWFSDLNSDTDAETQKRSSHKEAKQESVTYAEVVRELLAQVDNGCDLIPIDSTFSYEDLMDWVKSHAQGNKMIIINGTLEKTTGQVLAVAFANDNKLLLSAKMPKACFVYTTLNETIQDLFPKGVHVYIKSFRIM